MGLAQDRRNKENDDMEKRILEDEGGSCGRGRRGPQ
jgi:hypothetical protein